MVKQILNSYFIMEKFKKLSRAEMKNVLGGGADEIKSCNTFCTMYNSNGGAKTASCGGAGCSCPLSGGVSVTSC